MSESDDDRFWAQVEGDSHRVLYTSADRYEQLSAAVERYGLARTHEVRVSPVLSGGKVISVDVNAVLANMSAELQKMRHRMQ